MKIILLTFIVSFYSVTGFAQSQCASLFSPQKVTTAYKTNSSLKRLNLAQKADEAADRLFSEFSKGKTVKEGVVLRNQTPIQEFKTPLKQTIMTLEGLLRTIEKERDHKNSYYSKISLTEFFEITAIIRDHVSEGKKILEEGKLEYKQTIFLHIEPVLYFFS